MPPQAALRQGLKSPSGFRPAMDFQHLRSDLELLVPVVKRFILVSPLLRFLQLQFIPLFYLTAQSFAFPLHSLYIPFTFPLHSVVHWQMVLFVDVFSCWLVVLDPGTRCKMLRSCFQCRKLPETARVWDKFAEAPYARCLADTCRGFCDVLCLSSADLLWWFEPFPITLEPKVCGDFRRTDSEECWLPSKFSKDYNIPVALLRKSS